MSISSQSLVYMYYQVLPKRHLLGRLLLKNKQVFFENDSLPDGWGRLLLNRKLMNVGFNPGVLLPLGHLCFVGTHGMVRLSLNLKIQTLL